MCNRNRQPLSHQPHYRNFSLSANFAIILLAFVISTADARAGGLYAESQFKGDYVVSLYGSFKSAPPPFTGDAVKLDAAIVGRYFLDGEGLFSGEHTLTFSNAAVTFGVVSRDAVSGSYEVEPDGHVVLYLEEDSIHPITGADGIVDNTAKLECYVVQRHLLARCMLHSLVTFQRGPDPVPLPATLSGMLESQR